MPARKRLRWVLVALAATPVLGALWLGSILVRADRLLEAHREDAARILAEIPPDARCRPAVFDPQEEGDAWDLLAEAFTLMDPDWIRERDAHPNLRLLGLPGGSMILNPEMDEATATGVESDPRFDLIRRALARKTFAPNGILGSPLERLTESTTTFILESAAHLPSQGKELAVLERAAIALGLAQDVARHGNHDHLDHLWSVETTVATLARTGLAAHRLSAEELGIAARWFERLDAGRPDLYGSILRDGALSRKDVIEEFENAQFYLNAPFPDIRPTWRDLWTRPLNKARRVAQIDRAVRAVEPLRHLPPWERARQAERILGGLDLSACDNFEVPAAGHFEGDAVVLLHRALLRVALALARFEAERGAFPRTLGDLVPGYLPDLPVSPCTGRPLEYEPGRVWSVPPRLGANPGFSDHQATAPEHFVWTVRRKTR